MLSAAAVSKSGGKIPFFVADLGGTYLRCAVAERDGLESVRRYRLRGEIGERTGRLWDELIENVGEFCRDNADSADQETPMIFAFPGPVTQGRIPFGAPTVLGRAIVPDLASVLGDAIGRQVIILNDVSAAAWYFARRIGVDRFAVVTISSGIGAKLFERRYPGGAFDDLPYAGEIGHLIVDRSPDAPMCDCGGRGHLGAIASGRGIEREARRVAALEPRKFGESACATL